MSHDLSQLSDAQAEAGVIATLFYHPEFILHSDYLKAGYFYNVENGCLYWAISELYKSGIDTIDAMNMSTMLNSNRGVKRTMERFNLQNLQEFIALAGNAARGTLEEYKLVANRVVELAFRRDLNKVTQKIQGDCFDSNVSLKQLNVSVNEDISKLTERYLISQEIVTFGDKADALWEEAKKRRTANGYVGIPTIIPALNDYVTYEKGEMFLLSARMKKGKSSYFLNTAIDMMKQNIPVCYIDTEMSSRSVLLRMLANITALDANKVRNGNYGPEEEQLINRALAWIKTKPFYHFYLPSPSMDEVYSILKILKYKANLQMCIYDYLKCDIGDGALTSNKLGEMTSFLKNECAGALDLAMVAGVQLSRDNRVAFSDKIDQYVSTRVMWEEKTPEERAQFGEKCGNYKVWVALNRNGPSHEEGEEWIDVQFDKSKMRIKQAEQHAGTNTPFD